MSTSTAQKQLAGLIALVFTGGGGSALWTGLEWYAEVNAALETLPKLEAAVHDLQHIHNQHSAADAATERFCLSGQLTDPVLCSSVAGWQAPPERSKVTILMNDPNAARLRAEHDARVGH